MLNINGKEIIGYSDYSKLTSDDIITFMKTRPSSEIQEFKDFAMREGEPKSTRPNFFEIRNWVLEKYEPGITARKSRQSMFDKIMDL